MKTLTDLFLEELADVYDAERRIAAAIPKMIAAAASAELKSLFETHLAETEGHLRRVERVFKCFDRKPWSKTSEAARGLLKEGDTLAGNFKGSSALDAALIAAAQKLEHFEMASYGCLTTWAGLLDNGEAATILEEILEEERAADEALDELALTHANIEAVRAEDAEHAGTKEK
jgi:ferritin-like metal-binding protein YciE